MDHKEQIVMYIFQKIQELNKRMKDDEEEINKKELQLQLIIMEDMLRDYFNLSD